MSPRPIEFPVEGLSDGVVSLRLLAEADLPGVIEAVGDPLIPRYTTVPDPYGEREARQWQRSSSQGIAAGTDLATVIVAADDGQLLGAVGLHGIGPASGRCSAGYWLAATARGKGLATRAVRLLCRSRSPSSRSPGSSCGSNPRTAPRWRWQNGWGSSARG